MALLDALSQFSVLVNDLKHASGKGVHDVLTKEFSRPQYDVVDNEEEILIEIKMNSISLHPLDLIEVKIQSLSVELKVKDYGGADHYMKICRLHDEINVKKSRYVISRDLIEVTLVKSKRGKWRCLHYHHPEVYKNFQDKVKTAIKSLPIIKNLGGVKQLLADQIWTLELFAMCGLDVLSTYLESPAVFKSLEQIIEDLKIEGKDPQANLGVVPHLFTLILIKERRDYEDSHPEALRFYESKEEKKEEETKKKTQKQIKAETLKLDGNRFIKNEKYMEAIQSYTEAIGLDPECPIYYLNRAIAYYNIGVYTLSLEDAAKALSINPFYCKAYYYLGECLLHDCFPNDALIAFTRAKLLEPFNRKIDDKLVETYKFRHNLHMFVECVRQNNEDGREKHLKELLKVMDNSIGAERLFKYLCDKDMIAEARVEAKKLGKIHNYNNYIELYFLAICSYYEDDEKKFNEHFKEYKKATEKSLIANIVEGYELCDSIADIYDNRSKGDEMYKKGNYKKAIEYYLKAQSNTDIIPLLSSKILLKIALAKRELKDKESISFIQESLKLKNDNHEAFAARGEFFLQEGMFDFALLDFTKAESMYPCRRYAELIEKAKAKEKPEDNSAASGQGKAAKNKKMSENRRKAVKKKEEGNKSFKGGDYRTAIKYYSEAIELDNSDAVFYSNRAACYINLKNISKAFEDCKKSLELDPSFGKSHFRLGQCHFARAEINEAISSFEKALELKFKDGFVQKELNDAKKIVKDIEKANKLFEDKQYDEAAKLFSSIVKKTVDAVELFNKLMECLMRLGRFEEALDAVSIPISSGGNFRYHYDEGICYLHERMLYYAHMSFKKALEHDPLNENLRCAIELLSEKSEFFDAPTSKESEKIVQRIFSMVSSSSDMCLPNESDLNLSKRKQKDGDSKFDKELYREALYCYTEALNLTPLNCSLYISRASCYVKLKKFNDAINEAKEALDIDDKYLEAFILVGNVELTLGYIEKAKSAFKEAESLDPQNEKVVLGLTTILKLENILEEADSTCQTKQPQKACDLYTEALEIAPASHCIHEKLGDCHFDLKPYTSFPLEDSYLYKFDDLDDFQLGTVYYLIGRRHYIYGNEKQSISSLEDAIKKNPSNEKYKKWLNKIKSVFSFIEKAMGSLSQNDFQSSLNYLNEAIQISQDLMLANITYVIGLVKLKQKEINEAIECFSKAIDIIHENFQTPYCTAKKISDNLSTFHQLLYEERNAMPFVPVKERNFQSALKKNRQILFSSLEKRAYCFKLQGHYSNALKDYEELYCFTGAPVYRSICDALSHLK